MRLKSTVCRLLIALTACAPLVAANPSPYPAVAYPVTLADVAALPLAQGAMPHAYGRAPNQYGLLWLPREAQPVPLVMLVHGGCWRSDSGVEQIQPLASALVRAGYAVWAPEYRRVGEEGGGWPGTFDDLRSALLAATALQPSRIDTSRTVLAGHSTGGHLALWLATRGQIEDAAITLRGAVGLAAITDLATYRDSDNDCATAVTGLLGGDPRELPDRYRDASPATIAETALPIHLVHGSADDVVPLVQSRSMPHTGLEVLEGAGHYDLIHPGTQAFPALLRAIDDVLSP